MKATVNHVELGTEIKATVSSLLDNYIQGGNYHSELEKLLGHDDFSHILADFKNEFIELECDEDGASLDNIDELEKIQNKYVDILLSTKK